MKSIFSIRIALGLSDDMKEKSLKELKIMAKIRSDYVVNYNHSWIENNEILYIQIELCLNTLKGIMEQKQNDFKRKRFEVMTPLEYYISSKGEPTLSHCAWAKTFDLVVRWQIY